MSLFFMLGVAYDMRHVFTPKQKKKTLTEKMHIALKAINIDLWLKNGDVTRLFYDCVSNRLLAIFTEKIKGAQNKS